LTCDPINADWDQPWGLNHHIAVMMQAFYWDAPIRENKRGE
jgi:hypothetical protein